MNETETLEDKIARAAMVCGAMRWDDLPHGSPGEYRFSGDGVRNPHPLYQAVTFAEWMEAFAGLTFGEPETIPPSREERHDGFIVLRPKGT